MVTTDKNITTQKSTNLLKHQCRHSFARNTIKRFHNALVNLLATIKPVSILSAGCGEGFDLKYILESNTLKPVFSFGLDFNFAALISAKDMLANYNFDAAHGNIYHLPFQLNKFDTILCLEVLEHLEQPELVLEAIAQHYGGYCIFSVPNEPFFQLTRMLVARKNIRQFGNHPEHLQRWSKRRFIRLVSEYFTIDKVFTPYPWTMVLCRKS